MLIRRDKQIHGQKRNDAGSKQVDSDPPVPGEQHVGKVESVSRLSARQFLATARSHYREAGAVVMGAVSLVAATQPVLAQTAAGQTQETVAGKPATSTTVTSNLPDKIVGTTVVQDLAQRTGASNSAIFSHIKSMGFNTVRLGAYWNEIQPDRPDRSDFSKLDDQLEAAQKAGLKVILTVGAKAPGDGEYHIPNWVSTSGMNVTMNEPGPRPGVASRTTHGLMDKLPGHHSATAPTPDTPFAQQVSEFDRLVVEHVRDNPNVIMYSVEPEATEMTAIEGTRLSEGVVGYEMQAVRAADPSRPIMREIRADDMFMAAVDPKLENATATADVVGVNFHPGNPNSPIGDTGAAQADFSKNAREYVTQHGKRIIISSLPADNQGPIKVELGGVQMSWNTVREQGYLESGGGVLFSNQMEVIHAISQHDMSWNNLEATLTRQALGLPTPTAVPEPPANAAVNFHIGSLDHIKFGNFDTPH